MLNNTSESYYITDIHTMNGESFIINVKPNSYNLALNDLNNNSDLETEIETQYEDRGTYSRHPEKFVSDLLFKSGNTCIVLSDNRISDKELSSITNK